MGTIVGRNCLNSHATGDDAGTCYYSTPNQETGSGTIEIDITQVEDNTNRGMFCLDHYETKNNSGQCEDNPRVRRIATIEECAANWPVATHPNPPAVADINTSSAGRPGGCGYNDNYNDPYSFNNNSNNNCNTGGGECLCKLVSPPAPGTPPVFPTSR